MEEAIQIIEGKFWRKCIEIKCDKNRGFDFRDRDFFDNTFEVNLFETNVLPQLIGGGYICRPLNPSLNSESLDRFGVKKRIVVTGTPTSVYFFTETGIAELYKKYYQKLIDSDTLDISGVTNYNIDGNGLNININPQNSTIINKKV